MAKSTKAPLTGRIQKCKTNPSIAHIGLATHGRSIQISNNQPTTEDKACLAWVRRAAGSGEGFCDIVCCHL